MLPLSPSFSSSAGQGMSFAVEPLKRRIDSTVVWVQSGGLPGLHASGESVVALVDLETRVQLQRVHEPLTSLLGHSAHRLVDDLHAAEACEAALLAVDLFVCGDKLRNEKGEEERRNAEQEKGVGDEESGS